MSQRVETPPPPPSRPADSHKGTYGTVVVLGGSPTMIGAPAIAARAALRTGCGLARIMTDPEVLPHCLTIEPSATGLVPPPLDQPERLIETVAAGGRNVALAVGPGLGVCDDARRTIAAVLDQPEIPVVLDADGLNNLARLGPHVTARCPLIVTPHPGEFRRLADALGISHSPIDPEQRIAATDALADALGAVAVLKGRGTIVSDGRRHYVNRTGNPALATAGTGDVLTGCIASLLAQGLDRFDAAALGVHLHGLAADLWADRPGHGPAGLMAHDLANWLPHAIEHHRQARNEQ